ncbi:hypothetical protein LTR35_003104 [Friedmanniomyces endolithicus]|uniref:Uncharacterized protein n=1 Tax=Friedmanniomyces endolithicus TaxID=329885 RepID=A0AAN6FE94_9PEZI|nr:hypothetical protein LTR35_003104 [Friedmanniomyces endolithicus]KAK0300474.1 hypothetical protein LTS00_000729 [Friedmanniomyces endolithicus]KAK0312251.1 hypothetical protein LTR82_014047 [Friedmanniomyces endolithicus]KAK0998901.1 hypothetical protein LTR54_009341 [Friedmanniomyces endolithicus]
MPFRKSESSDAASDSKRKSLQRLSSIASFQALNPFTRRRSNNTTDTTTTNSSTSKLSLSSTTANAPLPPPQCLQSSSSQLFSIEGEVTALSIPPVLGTFPSRRSSYICLPDDPIGGMPRSRTFSNLPLPNRARRNTALPRVPSQSHTRIPSAFLSSSRLPSPAASNRKHSVSKLPLSEPKAPVVRNRMKRSDTEPLLPLNVESVATVGRATAFKENISPSPVKLLPETAMYEDRDFYDSSYSPRGYADRHGWVDIGKGSEPLLHFDACGENFSSSLRDPQHVSHASKASFSSPAYRSTRERPSTPAGPAPVQRWNSQPVLTNVTNRRNSRHGEILERRLLSAVQPDPPAPPPETTLSAEALVSGKVTALKKSTPQLPQLAERDPSLSKLLSKARAPSPSRSAQQITTAEPVPYWCGRFSALNDRYRNDELALHLGASKAQSDKMHSVEANTRRMRRALERLHGLCATPEARESLVVFQLQFAAMQGLPELGRPLQLNLPERKIVLNAARGGSEEERGVSEEIGDGVAEKRKGSFMDRLLGRSRRSLQGLV